MGNIQSCDIVLPLATFLHVMVTGPEFAEELRIPGCEEIPHPMEQRVRHFTKLNQSKQAFTEVAGHRQSTSLGAEVLGSVGRLASL